MTKDAAGLLAAELVATGDELTTGAISDTNGSWACARLRDAGIAVRRITVVGDAQPDIEAAIFEAASRSQIVIVSGGLGPTEDDRTAAAAARCAGVALTRNAAALEHVRGMFAKYGVPMTANNEKQADLPDGCELLDNPVGTAVGFALTVGTARVFFTPGVPHEYKKMVEEQVLSRLASLERVALATRVLRVYGFGESKLETELAGVPIPPEVQLGFRAAFPEIHLRLYVQGAQDLTEILDRAEAAIRSKLAERLFATGDTTLAGVVGGMLKARGWKLALAESCTGGMLGMHVTAESGSSEWFERGWVTYSYESKTAELGVPADVIVTKGAVSEEVARAMAQGALTRAGAQLALAVTGIAGPSGGTADKPVGTVWIAAATARGVIAKRHNFRGDRDRVRLASVWAALDMGRRELSAS
jgi:nicotinamide-nucleotide amidase